MGRYDSVMAINFGGIILEQEQKDLLARFVEAVRSVPSDQRQPVFVLQSMSGTQLLHPGFKPGETLYIGDLEMLARVGLLNVKQDRPYSHQVEVTPEGFAYYRELKRRSG